MQRREPTQRHARRHRRAGSVLMLCLAAVLGLSACKRGNAQTPSGAFELLVQALKKDERKKAVALLSAPTRNALEARAKAISEASGGSVRPDLDVLLFGLPVPPRERQEVLVLEQNDTAAKLRVRWDDRTQEYRFVREPSGWKLHLDLGSVEASPAPSPAPVSP